MFFVEVSYVSLSRSVTVYHGLSWSIPVHPLVVPWVRQQLLSELSACLPGREINYRTERPAPLLSKSDKVLEPECIELGAERNVVVCRHRGGPVPKLRHGKLPSHSQ